MTAATKIVMSQVEDERRRQDAKWGQQNWLDGTGPDVRVSVAPGSLLKHKGAMEQAKLTCNLNMHDGTITWADIFKEEVFEALCEEEWTALRAELIQCAAVAVAWIEAGDRRFFKMLEE